MSELVKQLFELGYIECYPNYNTFEKYLDDYHAIIVIIIDFKDINIIDSFYLLPYEIVEFQLHIDNIQKAFNIMQRDLEVLGYYV